MGKIKQIKAERKKAQRQVQLKKKAHKIAVFKYFLIFIVFMAVGGASYFGYSWLDVKYNLSNKLLGTSDKEEEEQVTERRTYTEVPEMQIDVEKQYTAKFETNKGNFEAILYSKGSPTTVNNFVVLSRDGFYNGLTFHRIIQDFMIQGGDPEGIGSGGPGYQFDDEFNEHKLVRGSLAMANSGENTNGSQFFIVTAEETSWLDGKHTNFGQITEGLAVVLEMDKTETDEGDKPLSPITINKIEIVEK